MANGLVSTEPTSKGEVDLDVFHPSYRVKCIIKRPVSSFHNDLWLDIKDCEARGYIRIKIFLEEDKIESLTEQILACYTLPLINNSDGIIKDTNTIRKEVIELSLKNFLFPYSEIRTRDALTEQSQDFVLNDCAEKFREQIMSGPYKVEEGFERLDKDHEFPLKDIGVKVLSFIVDVETERYPIVQMAAVDQYGELMGEKVLHNFILRNMKNPNEREKPAYEKDIEAFIKQYESDLIVIGANRLEVPSMR